MLVIGIHSMFRSTFIEPINRYIYKQDIKKVERYMPQKQLIFIKISISETSLSAEKKMTKNIFFNFLVSIVRK